MKQQSGWVKNQIQNIFGGYQHDNRLATKLFGSKKGFSKDRVRPGRGAPVVTSRAWVIHPMSSFRSDIGKFDTRRIKRREKWFLALKGYGDFMYASSQFSTLLPTNTGKDSCRWIH